MKNLLVLANISSDNDQLIEYAAAFCKQYRFKLHLLYVSSNRDPVLVSSAFTFINQEFLQSEIEQGKKLTHKLSTLVAPILDKEFVQMSVHQGNQEQVLKSFVNDKFIDIIMLGTSDLEKESEFVNHKNILMNVIDTPLFVVPENHLFSELSRFNFLTTHTVDNKQNLVRVFDMFPETEMTLTHFRGHSEGDEKALTKSQKWFDYVSAKTGKTMKYESLEMDIRKYMESENYGVTQRFDAFVFTSRKRNFWSRLIDPSTTLGILAGLELPSLIFKV
jgi:nucleotide-binding universal stress UspA family protein